MYLGIITLALALLTGEVTKDEQIQLLVLQRDELTAEVANLRARIARMEGVGRLAEEWNKRGCVVELDDKGLVRCKATKDEKK